MMAANNPRRTMRTHGGYLVTGPQITAIQALTTLCDYPRDPIACRREALARLSAITELRAGHAMAWYPNISALELEHLAAFATESQKMALRPLWAAVVDRDTLEAPGAW